MTTAALYLDCDPGIDDAFALFCAFRFADVAAVGTVNGNVDVDRATNNAHHISALAGVDVPIHRGAARPLVVEPHDAARVHGRSGLGDTIVPVPERPLPGSSAAQALADLADDGPVTVVATGPLTNIALAIDADPGIVDRIEHVYWMGGSSQSGNVTEAAEFNSWADPHAVDVTVRSGVGITMFGLNLTRQVRMSTTHATALDEASTPTARLASSLLGYYVRHGVRDGLGQPMHDPCAVLGLTHPELFAVEPAHMAVDVDGDHRGRTVTAGQPFARSSPIDLAVSASADRIIDLIMTATIRPHER